MEFLRVFLCFGLLRFYGDTLGIELFPQWKKIIKEACKKKDFLIGSGPHCIVEGRQVSIQGEKDIEFYFLPRLMLWDPLNEIHKQSRWPILCPEHYHPLTPSDCWMDGSLNSQNPRVLWDTTGPLFLVAREYICDGNDCNPGHRIRTTDGRLLALAGRSGDDVIFSQKYSFTKILLTSMNDLLLSGMSFNQMNLFLHQRVQDLIASRLSRIKSDVDDGFLDPIDEGDLKKIEEMSQRLIHTVPDDETLKRVFNQWSKINKEKYDADMTSKNATALMADHTFKVLKHQLLFFAVYSYQCLVFVSVFYPLLHIFCRINITFYESNTQ